MPLRYLSSVTLQVKPRFLPSRRVRRLALVFVCCLNAAAGLRADEPKPFLHPLFSDNMVLQRDTSDAVWGWTTPGQTVTVTLDDQAGSAVAGPDGKWMARVGPLPAGGPHTLTVNGPQTVTLKNVLFGDVWLCSGQSNMGFGIREGTNGPQEIAAADHPDLRLFTVPQVIARSPRESLPVSATQGCWQVCSPQTVRAPGGDGFSAVAYFFGRDLAAREHVPVGLINTSFGGTPAEAWTSVEALGTVPELATAIAFVQLSDAQTKDALLAWFARNDPGSAGFPGWADPAMDTSAWKTMALPQYFQDAGDPELDGTNGVIWFRRTFDLSAGAEGKDATLRLSVDDDDVTWVNGTRVGATEGVAKKRAYPIPASLLKPAGNVVAVRVFDSGGKGGILGTPADLTLQVAGESPVSLAGPWLYKLGTSKVPPAVGSSPNAATVLFNGMVAPLVPFNFKGALWYQGESNVGQARFYRTLLPLMIQDWRTRFGQGDFPFLIVQLAGFAPGGEAWAELREAQMMTAQRLPQTGIMTAIDLGEEQNIHPRNKQEVGRRLALVAEEKVYGEKEESSGPVYRSMQAEGGSIRLTFDHVGGGLRAKDGEGLASFEVAGSDGKFLPADAKIDGGQVVVSSAQVPAPVAARYAWASYPKVSLYNEAGLPAFPFRTNAP